MAVLAIWLQDVSAGGFSPTEQVWIVVALIGIAAALLIQSLLYVVGGLVALRVITKVKGTVEEARRDMKGTTDEIKAKIYPLVDSLTHAGKTAKDLLDDSAPKIKAVTEHLVETSKTVRDTAEKLGQTVSEANQKTQRQVARVDHMVTSALDTTAEIAATVEHGIKVPAQKIAQVAVQTRYVVEGLLERIKGMASGLPFMQQHKPSTGPSYKTRGPVAYPAPPPAPPTTGSHTPPAVTAPVRLVK